VADQNSNQGPQANNSGQQPASLPPAPPPPVNPQLNSVPDLMQYQREGGVVQGPVIGPSDPRARARPVDVSRTNGKGGDARK
jgi:hypothetical protein